MSALRTFYQSGMLGRSQDWNNDGYNVGTLTGEAVAALTGLTESLPAANPLTVVPAGAALAVTIGGAAQSVNVRDSNGNVQIADFIPAKTMLLNAADPTQVRVDTISMVYSEVDAGDFPVDELDDADNYIPGGVTAHYVGRSIALTYTPGTPGQPAPAAPSGTYVLAHVQVPAAATSLTSANIAMYVPAMRFALQTSGVNPGFLFEDPLNYIEFFAGPATTSQLTVYAQLRQPYPTIYGSSDGSVDIDLSSTGQDPVTYPVSLDLKLNAAAVQAIVGSGGTAGGAGTAAYGAGIVYCSQRQNYGTQSSPYNSGGDDNFAPEGTFLGGLTFSSVFNIQQAVQFEFGVRVKAGAGAQTIGGKFITNAARAFMSLDATTVDSFPSSSTLTRTWTATVPDDGAYHYLILHLDHSGSIQAQFAAFVPTSANGGVDATKFDYFGLPATTYPH